MTWKCKAASASLLKISADVRWRMIMRHQHLAWTGWSSLGRMLSHYVLCSSSQAANCPSYIFQLVAAWRGRTAETTGTWDKIRDIGSGAWHMRGSTWQHDTGHLAFVTVSACQHNGLRLSLLSTHLLPEILFTILEDLKGKKNLILKICQ